MAVSLDSKDCAEGSRCASGETGAVLTRQLGNERLPEGLTRPHAVKQLPVREHSWEAGIGAV